MSCVTASAKQAVLKYTQTHTQEISSHISPVIHFSTGSLSIFKPLDREEQDVFNLTIIAEDHGIPQHSSSQLLCVHVIDVNDEVPWFEESQYDAQISENQPPGTSVLTVSASDLDQGEVYNVDSVAVVLVYIIIILNQKCIVIELTTLLTIQLGKN